MMLMTLLGVAVEFGSFCLCRPLRRLPLRLNDFQQLVLYRVSHQLAVPMAGLLLDQLLDKRHHLGVGRLVADPTEIGILVPDLVAIAQGPQHYALATRLEHDRAFAPVDHKTEMPTIFFAAIASRITENASSPTWSFGVR